jgi:hypothetical protein
MYSSAELFARLHQLSPDKLRRTEEMLSFRIKSLQDGVRANGGFRLDVATTPGRPHRLRMGFTLLNAGELSRLRGV